MKGPSGGLKFCRKLGCRLLVHPILGCPRECPHRSEEQPAGPRREEKRPTAHARGYTRAWRKFREWYLAQPENALCKTCEAQGFTRAARELHHIVPLRRRPGAARSVKVGPKTDVRNLMGLCSDCHGAITRAFAFGEYYHRAIELEALGLWARAGVLRGLCFEITRKRGRTA